jgi:hypothetical protein
VQVSILAGACALRARTHPTGCSRVVVVTVVPELASIAAGVQSELSQLST